LWEGVDSLNEEELQDACQERGMRARGLTMYGYKKQLKGWIDLSIQKNVPISLLIMSRAFVLHESLNPETVLRDSLSSLDADIINEVVIEAASGIEKDSLEIRQRRLESIEFQQEMMDEEREDALSAETASLQAKKDSAKALLAEKQQTLLAQQQSADKVASVTSKDVPAAEGTGEVSAALTAPVVPESFMGRLKGLVKGGEVKEGDAATATFLAEVIDEAVGTGKLGTDKLTVAELQLLDDISRGSVVGREKEMLALMRSKIEPLTPRPPPGPYASSASAGDSDQFEDDLAYDEEQQRAYGAAAGRGSEGASSAGAAGSSLAPTDGEGPHRPAAQEEDGESEELLRMRRVLDSMLNKLQSRIQSAEEALDGKIQLLDEDHDGIISSSELKDTMKKILKRYPTDEEAEAFVVLLDQDQDGEGTVYTLHVCCAVTASLHAHHLPRRLVSRITHHHTPSHTITRTNYTCSCPMSMSQSRWTSCGSMCARARACWRTTPVGGCTHTTQHTHKHTHTHSLTPSLCMYPYPCSPHHHLTSQCAAAVRRQPPEALLPAAGGLRSVSAGCAGCAGGGHRCSTGSLDGSRSAPSLSLCLLA
jgi:hypothetical protein